MAVAGWHQILRRAIEHAMHARAMRIEAELDGMPLRNSAIRIDPQVDSNCLQCRQYTD